MNNLFGQNTIEMSAKYLMARSDSHARKMLVFPLFGTLLGPLIWMLPPLVAAAVYSPEQIKTFFPNLGFHPEEGAFLITAHDVLPQGMLGLLLAGIFGATLSNLDTNVNQGVGILVRNFYLPVINPQCSEKKLLVISKIATGLFGSVIIAIGLVVSKLRTLPLFDLLNQLGVSLWLPLAVPLCLGLFYKRTPSWSSWSTVLIGLVMSFVMKFCTTPDMFSWLPGLHGPFKPEEMTQYYLIATVAGVSIVCISWFFFTSLFYKSSPAAYKESVEEFFTRLKTPIEALTAEQSQENHRIVGSIGKLCMVFGSFVLMMMAVPNPLMKRFGFLFCGGLIFVVGTLLARVAKKHSEAPQL